MRIFHLDVPRGLSFTLKEWNASCHDALSSDDAGGWRQLDLTFDFWRWLLGERFGEVTGVVHQDARYTVAALRSAERVLTRKTSGLDCAIGWSGLAFPERATATPAALLAYVRDNPDRAFFDAYFRHLADEHLLLSGCSIVSLGVDSLDGIVFAALLADFVHRHDRWIRVVLTRHQYENYSLVHRIEELVAEGSLFRLFDAVVPFEEKADEALLALRTWFSDGDASSLTNVAIATPEGPRLHHPPSKSAPRALPAPRIDAHYIEATGIAPRDLVVFAPLVRNACYYGRCTFCVQNERYLAPQLHKHGPELARAIAMIREYARHGVRSFSFSDQALHPKFLRLFAAAVAEQGLDIRWCGRMLFHPQAIDEDLCAALTRSGCREILFGLESMNRETLRTMDKDLGFDSESATVLLDRLERHGIDVVLSLIYAFPTESDEAFERETLPFVRDTARRFANVSVILNRFAAFRDTPLEKRPDDFGIIDLAPVAGPFAASRDLVDVHGRDSRAPHPRAAEYQETATARSSDPVVSYVDYSSMGLAYRWANGEWFASRVAAAERARPMRRFAERDTLVLGSGSYVGRNLALALDPRRVVLSSRGPADVVSRTIDAPYLRVDLARGPGALSGVAPREVYVVARPTGTFAEQSTFAANLKTLLHDWAERGLERVVFFSTQLVYATPADAEPIATSAPLAPVAAYEYFKSELEGFLRWTAQLFPLGVEIVRLPLAFGGVIDHVQREQQLIYAWADAISAGARFETNAEDYGTSFVHVPDLVTTLQRGRGAGFHLRQPVSGDFTYTGLQRALVSTAAPPSGALLDVVRSRFFLADEDGVPRRDLSALLQQAFSANPPRPSPVRRLPVVGASSSIESEA